MGQHGSQNGTISPESDLPNEQGKGGRKPPRPARGQHGQHGSQNGTVSRPPDTFHPAQPCLAAFVGFRLRTPFPAQLAWDSFRKPPGQASPRERRPRTKVLGRVGLDESS
jgi:hypothetical protein